MCKGISKRIVKGALNEAESEDTINHLINMSIKVHSNLALVLDDYGNKNCQNALKVWRSDSEIDSLYSGSSPPHATKIMNSINGASK